MTMGPGPSSRSSTARRPTTGGSAPTTARFPASPRSSGREASASTREPSSRCRPGRSTACTTIRTPCRSPCTSTAATWITLIVASTIRSATRWRPTASAARPPLLAKKEFTMMMSLGIGDTAPDFTADTTQGRISFHEWMGNGWAILFSHPKDFTPICTTELGYMAKLKPEFAKRNTKILAVSIDPATDHNPWVTDIEETQGTKLTYPIIGDSALAVAKAYGMLHPNAGDSSTA